MRLPASPALAALAALALWGSGASAEIADITWDANGRYQRSLSLAPGKLAELCGRLPAGLKLHWAFEASAPLDFNVHYHVGKAVEYPVKLSAVAAAKDTLDTKTEQDYCWMWTNPSAAAAAVTVTVRLQR